MKRVVLGIALAGVVGVWGGTARAQEASVPAAETTTPVDTSGPVAAPFPVIPVTADGPDAAGNYMLREGAAVKLQFAEDLNSKTASEGKPVAFTLAADLRVGGVVVAKAGSKAVGAVVKAEKSGMLGKVGDLSVRLDYVEAGPNKVMLRGTRGGGGSQAGVVVLTGRGGPIGLMKHEKNVEIKRGQALPAFVAVDVALPPAA